MQRSRRAARATYEPPPSQTVVADERDDGSAPEFITVDVTRTYFAEPLAVLGFDQHRPRLRAGVARRVGLVGDRYVELCSGFLRCTLTTTGPFSIACHWLRHPFQS